MVCRLFCLLGFSLNHSFYVLQLEKEHLISCWPVWTHLQLLPLQGPRSRRKAWKVITQTAPASRSCVPPAASIWRTSISTRDSPPLPIPSESSKDRLILSPQALRKDAIGAIMSDWIFSNRSSVLKTFHALSGGVAFCSALSGFHRCFTTCHSGALSTLTFNEISRARDTKFRTDYVSASLSLPMLSYFPVMLIWGFEQRF